MVKKIEALLVGFPSAEHSRHTLGTSGGFPWELAQVGGEQAVSLTMLGYGRPGVENSERVSAAAAAETEEPRFVHREFDGASVDSCWALEGTPSAEVAVRVDPHILSLDRLAGSLLCQDSGPYRGSFQHCSSRYG